MKKRWLVLALVSLFLLLSSCSNEPLEGWYYDHLIAMWAESLKPQEPEIAFYGDSRVALLDWSAEYPLSKVVNLGVGGDRVWNLLKRLPLLEALDIKTCFLAIGINDLTSSHFDKVAFRAEYDTLLSKLGDMDVAVYVQTIVGITTHKSNFSRKQVRDVSKRVLAANEIIWELAETHGMDVIDLAGVMNNEDGSLKGEYSSDGIHYNQAGNDAWVALLRPYVESP